MKGLWPRASNGMRPLVLLEASVNAAVVPTGVALGVGKRVPSPLSRGFRPSDRAMNVKRHRWSRLDDIVIAVDDECLNLVSAAIDIV